MLTTMMPKQVIVIFVLLFAELFINVCCITKSKYKVKTNILNQILPTNPNEILVAPGNGTSGYTLVTLYLHVKSVVSLNDEKMELTSNLFIRQVWNDARLQYDSDKTNISTIVINDPKVIWTPDIHISNAVKRYSSDILTRYIRISPDGTVLYSMSVLITTSCPMNLKRFPFDKQTCDILISTYGSEAVLLIWRETRPATILEDERTGLFSLENVGTRSQDFRSSIGSYNILFLSFVFKRELGYRIVSIFIPCMMLVFLSWISLWISRKLLIIRLILGLSALATCTILVCDQHKYRTTISYSTSMDYFTGISLTFIFVSIIESIIVYLLGEKADNLGFHLENEELKGAKQCRKWFTKIPVMADKIDCWARLIMPLMSLLFCIIYFCVVNTDTSSLEHQDYAITPAAKI